MYETFSSVGRLFLLPKEGVIYYLRDWKMVYSYAENNPTEQFRIRSYREEIQADVNVHLEMENDIYFLVFTPRIGTPCTRYIHREDGPAIETEDTFKLQGLRYFLFGRPIRKDRDTSDADKWALLKGNPENIQVIGKPSLEMQEYVIQRRPDLVALIGGLDPSLKSKYQHEVEMGGVDL